ncbi:hypothetical protein GQ44DRAFT_670765 [Phaeosphaeriaceae sp. PMI808]|nr:hypothetical protein GQ44DRAFT_670765 [Phaeosphaeriaceae sp. PMI808]
MARTRSSYTASPTHSRSPQRSPARAASKDGSEYEMDLDALGLNSTFESSEVQANYETPIDHVDTSEIEGPEDFTMNMTYWMTADLPLAQIKSRKEARGKIMDARMDTMQEEDVSQHTSEQDQQTVVIEAVSMDHKDGKSTLASPTRHANGTTDEHTYSTPPSERSMENDEKVRSFLSALPDTEMEGAIGGTPLHIPKQSFLQPPRSSPPKARSLQPTVEDYDTPRKPTQETVIHHIPVFNNTSKHDALQDQIADLQSQIRQQELASRTRITELETILSFTRSELESARTDNYKQKEKVTDQERTMQKQRQEIDAAHALAEAQLRTKEGALATKMQDFGEEMRLQNLAKLENQRKDFDRQLRVLEESKRLVDEEVESRGTSIEQLHTELASLGRSNNQQRQERRSKQTDERDSSGESAAKENAELTRQLSTVQAGAENLQAQLMKATAEAKAYREYAANRDENARHDAARISALETNLQAARFDLECAQADVAAKHQLFRTNIDLNSRIRRLQSDLDSAQYEIKAKGQQEPQRVELETRISSLQSQLELSRIQSSANDEEISRHVRMQEELEQGLNTARGRTEGLEIMVTTLRQQLGEAHRDSARARTDSERFAQNLEDVNDRLEDARAEADRRVADVEKKLNKMKESKSEAERKFREMQSQYDSLTEAHEEAMEDVRDKAEDAVRKAGALLDQERNEKRRVVKDLQRAKKDLERLSAEAARNLANEDESTDDDDTKSPVSTKETDTEIKNLRDIIRRQVSEMKTLTSEISSLRKEEKKQKLNMAAQADFEVEMSALREEVKILRAENVTLQSNMEDQEAINAAMDEKLATLLSKLMKERAKTVVGKRDGQWQESVEHVQSEKELMGKALMRQWGREEIGIAEEKRGERQGYQYQYVKRERMKT